MGFINCLKAVHISHITARRVFGSMFLIASSYVMSHDSVLVSRVLLVTSPRYTPLLVVVRYRKK